MRQADEFVGKGGNSNVSVGGGGGSTTKDIGNTNPPTQWSTTTTQVNQKYEQKANKKGTNKQNSRRALVMANRWWQKKHGTPSTQPPKATADIGNPNPPNRITTSPSSLDTTTKIRTTGGDLALRARASRSGGSGGRSHRASGSGFISRG
jgi:hypothetical protein